MNKGMKINWPYLESKGLLADPKTLDELGRMRLAEDLRNVFFEMQIRGNGIYSEMKRLYEIKEQAKEQASADYGMKYHPIPKNWDKQIVMIRRAQRGISRGLPIYHF
jgi:hypothetical protein